MALKVVIASDSKSKRTDDLYQVRQGQKPNTDRYDQPPFFAKINQALTDVYDATTETWAAFKDKLSNDEFM